MDNNATTPQSVIAAEAEITGTIKTSGSIRLDGKLEGELNCGGDAVIGKSATIKGNLTVNTASIAGSVTGNITARDRIEMKSTARVMGDIKAKRLAVEDGVTFVGKSEVNPSGGPAPTVAPEGVRAEPAVARAEEAKAGIFGKR